MNTVLLTRVSSRRLNLTGLALLVGAALLLSGTSLAAPLVSSAAPNAPADSVSAGWLNQMRQAGLRGDRSQIPRMVEIFQNPPGAEALDVAFNTRASLLRPLALLGATEALPALEEVIQSASARPLPGQPYILFSDNEQIIALSKAVKARILAQSATQSVANDKARAAAEVQRFFQELGQTPERLNAAVAAYEAQNRRHLLASRLVSDVSDNAAPVELCAVRELADMAYRDRYRGFMSLPDVARVDFAQDDRAAVKARLAPLPREQRIAALVNEMSQEEIGDRHTVRLAQLLVDEGPSALPMIAAKQQYVKAHRERYRGKFGYPFGGLSVLGDAEKQFATVADAVAKPQANGATGDSGLVWSSWPRQIAPGY